VLEHARKNPREDGDDIEAHTPMIRAYPAPASCPGAPFDGRYGDLPSTENTRRLTDEKSV
jgi:hypothetical protein